MNAQQFEIGLYKCLKQSNSSWDRPCLSWMLRAGRIISWVEKHNGWKPHALLSFMLQTQPLNKTNSTTKPPARHHRDTTEKPPRHHRDTGTHPAQASSREPDGAHPPLEITTPIYRYWGIKTIGKHGKLNSDTNDYDWLWLYATIVYIYIHTYIYNYIYVVYHYHYHYDYIMF
jgi:hypothetical protein